MNWSTSWLADPGAFLGRLVFTRALAVIYLIAFLVARNQFRPLIGSAGILPAPRYLARVDFSQSPSLFRIRWRGCFLYSDRVFEACCWIGAALALGVLAGGADELPPAGWLALWLALWALYLSIVNVGQVWYGFGWESLLCEAGFLAAFLGPASVAPPTLTMWLLRWLLVRVEFGAGLIKLRGDPCWRDLTCLRYHHETQPMPNPLSWYFHHLPDPLHRIEVLANHATQLVVIWGVLAPQPVASIAALVIVCTQAWLMLSGNFAWLNALTMTIALSVLSAGVLGAVLPGRPPAHLAAPAWFEALSFALTVLVAVLSYWPVRNMISSRQRMNASFNSLHLVNTYGAFGHVTRRRREVVIEASERPDASPDDATAWREYEFRGKPGDPRRRPPQVAPYHLRLDWLMWFAGISPAYGSSWLIPLLVKLLEADPQVLRLLRSAPCGAERPALVRARLYEYRFSTASERRASGEWWQRHLIGELVPPIARRGQPQ
jgi:uncharacterized membrane protein YhdT